MSIYKVTLQDETGEVTEHDCVVGWDPEKVGSDEVGSAFAAQMRYFSGKCTRNGEPSFKKLYQPISCELVVAESVLAE